MTSNQVAHAAVLESTRHNAEMEKLTQAQQSLDKYKFEANLQLEYDKLAINHANVGISYQDMLTRRQAAINDYEVRSNQLYLQSQQNAIDLAKMQEAQRHNLATEQISGLELGLRNKQIENDYRLGYMNVNAKNYATAVQESRYNVQNVLESKRWEYESKYLLPSQITLNYGRAVNYGIDGVWDVVKTFIPGANMQSSSKKMAREAAESLFD